LQKYTLAANATGGKQKKPPSAPGVQLTARSIGERCSLAVGTLTPIEMAIAVSIANSNGCRSTIPSDP